MNLFRTALFSSLLFAAVAAQAQTVGGYSDLHDFGGEVTNTKGVLGPDGTQPQTSVVFDKAGDMFGTSQSGGGYSGSDGIGAGMVWEITAAGVYKDLHDFGGTVNNSNGKSGPDGTMPGAGVTIDANGNLYGTTYEGGLNTNVAAPQGGGIVWEITAAGVYKDLHDFGGTVTLSSGQSGSDGNGSTSIVTWDAQGNLYGTTNFGGPNSVGVIWEITTAGVYKDLHDFGGTVKNASGSNGLDGAVSSAGVTFDAAGNMYGTTQFGGPSGVTYGTYTGGGIVWEITAGGVYKDLHDFGLTVLNAVGVSGADGVSPYWGVTVDGSGNLFGTAQFGGNSTGDANVGMIWEITSAGQYKDLHDFGATVSNSDGSSGLDGEIPNGGVTLDTFGNLYGTTTAGGPNDPLYGGDGILWEINKSGVYKDIHDFGGSITVQSGASGGDGTYPGQITLDGAGNLCGSSYYGGPLSDGGMIWRLSLVSINISSVSVAPTSVIGGNSSTGTVTISQAAPSGGYAVPLASSSASATVPTSVLVAAQGVTGIFTVSTVGVAASTSVTITAGVGSGSKTATLTLTAAALSSVSVSPTSVAGGNAATGTVTLSGAAGPSGLSVTLASASTLVKVPSSVTVASGSKTGTFAISTSGVSVSTPVKITATAGGASQSATLTLTVPVLAHFTLSPTTVLGGVSSTGTVSMNGNAGTKGAVVTLTASATSAVPPKSVTIPSGQSQATFTVKTTGVPAVKVVTLTAKSGAVTLTATLTINPPTLSSLSLSPTTVVGGASVTGTVTLSSVAGSGGVPVKLTSSSASATLPASVTVASGKSSATFTLKTLAVGTQTVVTVTATLGSVSKTATVTINAPTLKSFTLSPTSVKGGANVTGTVTLTSAAPKGGLSVALSSTLNLAPVPGTVVVAAGSTSGKFTIKTSKVTAATSATITATLASTSLKATLSLH